MKKALVIGIDDYATSPLQGCVNDAVAVANMLEKNGDGSPNFDIRLLTSNTAPVNCDTLNEGIENLFQGGADIALLYFAGHGLINEAGEGYIVAQDGRKGAWGTAMSEVLALAKKAQARIKSTVVILDCCHSGKIGEIPAIEDGGSVSFIGNGVTILTACDRSEGAAEYDGHGLFTGILLDSLSGSAADICGRITSASVYAQVDQILGPWKQRPIYKTNVRNLISLRDVPPKIPLDILRRLPAYFASPSDKFGLDPSFEPDRINVPVHLKNIPVNDDNAKVFKELQICNRHGLITPVDAEHMYYAAINSTGCKLTALGAHYRKLAEENRI